MMVDRQRSPAAERGRRAWVAVAILLAPALLCAAAWWLDPLRFAAEPGLLVLNVLPVWLGWLLMLAGTRRVLWSAAFALLLLGVLQAINASKLAELEIPLLPSDLAAVRQVVETGDLYLRYVGVSLWWLLLLPVAIVAYRFEPAWRPHLAVRAALASVAIGALVSLAAGTSPWLRLYADIAPPFQPWATMETARTHGTVAYFVRSAWDEPWQVRAPDRAVLEAFWSQSPNGSPASRPQRERAPDLIVWQSEAFFDPAILAGIDDDRHLPNLAALRRANRHGDLRVPTYGGLTSRTEFEVLTGIALAAFPGVQYPYQRLVRRPLPALPHLLREHGYQTLAVHPYDPRFYRRNKVYPLLGFERFHAESEFALDDYHGFYVSDAALMRRVRELAEDRAPQMVFAISMENHGPWTPDRPLPAEELANIAVPAQLDAAGADELRRYLHHLQRVDAALGELMRWARDRDEPTVVLFYGDHLPGMDSVFATLGFDDGQGPSVQPVPWLLFDNARAPSESVAETRTSYGLAPVLLDTLGIEPDAHFRAMGLLTDTQTVFDAAERETLIHEFARDRIEQPAARLQTRPATPAQFVSVDAWGPGDVEADPERRRRPPVVWVRSVEPIARSTRIRIAGIDLDTRFENERVMVAQVAFDAPGQRPLSPGDVELQLFDPIDNRVQSVGRLRVREEVERVLLPSGARAASLCAVEGWGPSETSLSQPVNRQTDGGEGFWVQAGCLPRLVEIEVGARRYPASVIGQLATVSVAFDQLPSGERVEVALIDAETSERLVLGETRVDL